MKLVDEIQKMNAQNQDHKLFVGMVPKHIDEQTIRLIFEQCGPIEDVMILRDVETGEHKGDYRVFFLPNCDFVDGFCERLCICEI